MSRPMWHLVSLTVFPPPLRNTHIWSTCSATNVKLVSRLKLSWIYNTPLRNTQRCLDNTWSCKEVFNWLTVAVYIAHWQMYLEHLVHKYCTPFVQGTICKHIIGILWEMKTAAIVWIWWAESCSHHALLCYYALSKLSCALYLLQVTLNTAGLVQVTSLIEVHTRDLITIEVHTRDTQKPNCEFADRLLHVEHEILHIAYMQQVNEYASWYMWHL